jgi:hypothetical protein
LNIAKLFFNFLWEPRSATFFNIIILKSLI